MIWTKRLARLSCRHPAAGVDEKANEKALADEVSPHLAPGDLVVAIQMEEALAPALRSTPGAGPSRRRGKLGRMAWPPVVLVTKTVP